MTKVPTKLILFQNFSYQMDKELQKALLKKHNVNIRENYRVQALLCFALKGLNFIMPINLSKEAFGRPPILKRNYRDQNDRNMDFRL